MEETNIFSGGLKGLFGTLSGLGEKTKETGSATNALGSAFKPAIQGMLGMVKASLAFLATPIGFVVGLIGVAFVAVSTALGRSEESTNKLTKALAPLTTLFQYLLKGVTALGSISLMVLWFTWRK